jgi:hypothetical protein
VKGLVVPMVIGSDFLDEFKAIINYETGKVRLHVRRVMSEKKIDVPYKNAEERDEDIKVNYLGIGIICKVNSIEEEEEVLSFSHGITAKKLLTLRHEKMKELRVAEEEANKPTPEKIKKLVNEIPHLTNHQRRELKRILIENIEAFNSKPGIIKDFEYEIK